MSQSVTCPRGHRVPVEEPQTEAGVVCPECGSRCDVALHGAAASHPSGDAVSADNGSPRPHGLWGLMPSEPASSDSDAGSDRLAEPPKGLWALMGKPAAESETPESTAADETAAVPVDAAAEPSAAKGLWTLMRSGPTPASPTDSEREPPASAAIDAPEFRAVEIGELQQPVEAGDDDRPGTTDGLESHPTEQPAESEVPEIDDELEVAPLESLAVEQTETAAADSSPSVSPQFTPQRSRGAVRSAILGGVAVLASGLALLPEVYAKIPGTLVGFLALMVGLLALGEIRRSRGRQTGRNWAGAGIALGVLGMLLGPFVFSPLGGELRLRYGRRQTANDLERIGEALNAYYRGHDHFPPGSTHQQNKGGKDVPLHNWLTMLLPHLGEDEAALFQKTDLKLPYNHPTNRGAMERNVPVFWASGSSRAKTQAGFAVTHFVALGGTLDVENVGRVNVGIFSRNSRVKRSDVADGLEQTLVAGEIAFDFPAWGEPGQYRTIGKGLNVARDGFGNADRTGAMFLRADGSVKFLSNKVDLEVLRSLSTRNGRETVDRLSY